MIIESMHIFVGITDDVSKGKVHSMHPEEKRSPEKLEKLHEVGIITSTTY